MKKFKKTLLEFFKYLMLLSLMYSIIIFWSSFNAVTLAITGLVLTSGLMLFGLINYLIKSSSLLFSKK